MRQVAVLLWLLALPGSAMAQLEFLTVKEVFEVINFLAVHPSAPADYRSVSPFGPEASETRMPETFSDLARTILRCYHDKATYERADITQTAWDQQRQYGGDNSALIRIRYLVASSNEVYAMDVGLLSRLDQFRTAVLNDNSRITWNANCRLEKWTTLKP
jgi:hypothetical protein